MIGSEVQIRKCFRGANNRGSRGEITACVRVPVNNKFGEKSIVDSSFARSERSCEESLCLGSCTHQKAVVLCRNEGVHLYQFRGRSVY